MMRVAMTGAATGIGAAVARTLQAQGHHVTAFDICRPATGVDRWIEADFGSSDAIDAAVKQADGPFDALINNAGVPPREGQAELVLRVNYLGLVRFLDAMLGKLAPGAAIVNTASRAGAQWAENLAQVKALMALDPDDLASFIAAHGIDPTRAYTLSKEAVIVMTMARAEAMLARGLRMNSVSPAAVSTGILQDFATAFGDRMTRNVGRVGRPGTTQEVADVIAYLVSPQSAWIRGQDLVVDGGMSAMIASEKLGL